MLANEITKYLGRRHVYVKEKTLKKLTSINFIDTPNPCFGKVNIWSDLKKSYGSVEPKIRYLNRNTFQNSFVSSK